MCKDKEIAEEKSYQTGEFCDFESGTGAWDTYAWRKLFYDSQEAETEGIGVPLVGDSTSNQVLTHFI